jgi:hypothetical protein
VLANNNEVEEIFTKNGFIQEKGFELAKSATGKFYKTKNQKWVRDPESNRRPDFSWHDAFYSPKKSVTIAWDTETTTDGSIHERYTTNFYCEEFGSQRFETEKQMLNFLKYKGVKDVNIYAHNAKYDVSSSAKGILSNLIKQGRCGTRRPTPTPPTGGGHSDAGVGARGRVSAAAGS